MGKPLYRVGDNTPAGMVRRKAKAALPIALLGLGAYALWQKRDEVGGWIEQLKSKLDGRDGGRAAPAEVIPADYDSSRPSVFNSTAMAGPRGAATGTGIDGGTMGTDLGTQGEGAI